jgi:hypothetical protein
MDLTEAGPLPPPPYLAGGSRWAGDLVAAVLAGDPVPDPKDGDGDMAMTGATFLAHVLFTTQVATGADPHQARALLGDQGRGPELARRFLGAGTVQVCCDYCGGLMVAALAAAAAGQMSSLHGELAPAAWAPQAHPIMPPQPEAA